ncbi:MAG: hypothetical protein QXR58_01675 [Candidatus Micrarchaeaceae archaeon]
MSSKKNKNSRERLRKELEVLDSAMTLNRLVKKNELEGAFLTNSAKESETISDDVSDRIINTLEDESGRDESKGVEIINKFAVLAEGAEQVRRVKHKAAPKIAPKRQPLNRSPAKKSMSAKKTKIKKARRR